MADKEKTTKELIIKNCVDQPLHLAMGVISVNFFAWCFKGNLWLAVGMTALWEAVREIIQYPPHYKWDLWLDAAFEIIGIALGVFVWLKLFG